MKLPDSVCMRCTYNQRKGCGHPDYGLNNFQCCGDFYEPHCKGIPKVEPCNINFWKKLEAAYYEGK